MDAAFGPVQRTCCWCRGPFWARKPSDVCCSVGCIEEVAQQVEALRIARETFHAVQEQVHALHEAVDSVHRRIARQVAKLQRLGTGWRNARSAEELGNFEERENLTALTLERLNREFERRYIRALRTEKRLRSLEIEVATLKELIEDIASHDG